MASSCLDDTAITDDTLRVPGIVNEDGAEMVTFLVSGRLALTTHLRNVIGALIEYTLSFEMEIREASQ